MATTVWVASFAPAGEFSGVGGFQWAPEPERAHVEAEYEKWVRESESDGGHVVRLVQIDVESDLADRESVTAEIDSRLDEVESTLAAERQYVPAGIDAIFVPKMGVR